jgi:phosphoribosylformylglycinamidine cyclo-ligase
MDGGLTYRDAGVDLEQYEVAMERLPAIMRKTHTPRVMQLDGGFAGLFRLQGAGSNYKDPVLVSGTDGVGTKIKVAQHAGIYNTIGIDLVAMCVNDCLCLGAEPLFFLDYLALAKDDPDLITQLVTGVSAGCVQAKSALIGGETAIMPDLYQVGDFDLAGFSVGVVEKDQIIDGKQMQPGDRVIGIASSGFHSNGYSLIRKVVFSHAGLKCEDVVPEFGKTVGELLLTPTRIYADHLLKVYAAGLKTSVSGIAHITGGGLADNLVRVVPPGCQIQISRQSWQVPPVFSWVQKLGNVPADEMDRVFNMGIGLVVVVRPGEFDRIKDILAECGDTVYDLGTVTAGNAEVTLTP